MSKYDNPWIAKLAIPGVSGLIAFLSYSSQYLFQYLEPGPLTRKQTYIFNTLVACIWISYGRTCLTDPGHVPEYWSRARLEDDNEHDQHQRSRYCRKCDAPKPPRSHHCKVCKRCIPKMDHHCPWTSNCVSHFTIPHFMRFLFYATAAMSQLEYFIYLRAAEIWALRDMPAIHGPGLWVLIHFFMLIVANSLTLFLVGIMLFRGIYMIATNVTTIEGWEIERHEQLLRRARALGGYLDGPDGIRVKIERHEYPYDIGIWQNMRDNMGTANILSWFWPFARGVRTDGMIFETNGFEEPGQGWPPPDPDRMPRIARSMDAEDAFTYRNGASMADEVDAFKQRQQADLARRRPFRHRFDAETDEPLHDDFLDSDEDASGEEGWADRDGNRLQDYGVEEDVEFYDDVPLAELMKRRRAPQADDG
ncbi:Palmitoyltransferase pfa4 [Cyphellophora attinorum]|uniref:Palmitoyltransferase PFA4 n=1 Tax=Cyphellophora attinorum TaxID=1664694 RepID=A0A0N0NRC8_9EURO|nr:Palmitoyltransferase pfa4 [Phialophora attinorum]KPI44941.1 Palmitoyltransferase pfa4 [Phialophora attinorum]